MKHVLEDILRVKREEVAALKAAAPPAAELTTGRAGWDGRGGRDVERELALFRADSSASLRLITEIKRRSPSAGSLSTALSVGERAVVYARGGASMISVLCDRTFFDGGWEHLSEARAALDAAGFERIPLLAKEFVIDERQIDEAAARGADMILLIVRIVEDAAGLSRLISHARLRKIQPLVEVVTEDELAIALLAKATVIGVNARDLDTLAMDAKSAARVIAKIPAKSVAVHLSGLKTADDVRAVAHTHADAALIGEALMRLDDPSPLLKEMIDAALPDPDATPLPRTRPEA